MQAQHAFSGRRSRHGLSSVNRRDKRDRRRARAERQFAGLESLEARTLLSATIQFTHASAVNGVLEVTPGSVLTITASVTQSSNDLTAYQLDFSGTNPNLVLSNWQSDPIWTGTADATFPI